MNDTITVPVQTEHLDGLLLWCTAPLAAERSTPKRGWLTPEEAEVALRRILWDNRDAARYAANCALRKHKHPNCNASQAAFSGRSLPRTYYKCDTAECSLWHLTSRRGASRSLERARLGAWDPPPDLRPRAAA